MVNDLINILIFDGLLVCVSLAPWELNELQHHQATRGNISIIHGATRHVKSRQ